MDVVSRLILKQQKLTEYMNNSSVWCAGSPENVQWSMLQVRLYHKKIECLKFGIEHPAFKKSYIWQI